MDEGEERPGLFAKGGVGRFLLVLAAACALLFALACGGFMALMAVLDSSLPKHDEETASAKSEGAAFASGHTVTDCVTEARARGAASCEGLTSSCTRTVAAFARACVSTASEDGYCATTPQLSGDNFFDNLDAIDAGLEWVNAACAGFPPTSWCKEVMGEVQSGCRDRQRKVATDGAAPQDDAEVEDAHTAE